MTCSIVSEKWQYFKRQTYIAVCTIISHLRFTLFLIFLPTNIPNFGDIISYHKKTTDRIVLHGPISLDGAIIVLESNGNKTP
jgi:hypothetical protein